VQMHAGHGRLWTRISAQIYNDRSDIERLVDSVLRQLSRTSAGVGTTAWSQGPGVDRPTQPQG
jgi:hypothetical protein